jgi:hypothetical protein
VKNRVDEPICFIIHIYVEMYSYFKQSKYHFIFTRLENGRAEKVLSGELVPVGRRGMWGKVVGW